MSAKGPRWCWCPDCEAWIGSSPPYLGPYWTNEKSAWMHAKGTGHKVELLNVEQVLKLCEVPA